MVGRKRKYNLNIPAHIEQDKIPQGVYWDNARSHWYASNGKKREHIAEKIRNQLSLDTAD